MVEIRINTNLTRRLPFYLAMEEWVAHNLPPNDYIFSWRVNPTVICGRNQDIFKEVNMQYCQANGIDVVRRRSGGGCVYADLNNFMFSFIAEGGDVERNYGRYTSACASMLNSLGIKAEVSGRNDLLVDGAKIAGNAFYRLANRSIVHGTMLYDYNPERMCNAITPSKSKLESKAVRSVSNRVTSLKEHDVKLSLEEFGNYAINFFSGSDNIVLDDKELSSIEKLEMRYYDGDFLYGKSRKEQECVNIHSRINGVGEIDSEIFLADSKIIRSVSLSGDFFSARDVNVSLSKALVGMEYSYDSIAGALSSLEPNLIRNLDNEKLLEILYNQN